MDNPKPPLVLEDVKKLKLLFEVLYDEDLKPKDQKGFSKEVEEFNEIIRKAKLDKDITLREVERTIERWYEWYTNETPAPEYVSNTTLTPQQLKDLAEQAAIQKQKHDQTVKNQGETVAKFQEAGKKRYQEQQKTSAEKLKSRVDEINREQQRVQVEIAAAEAVQEKFKDKVVYAKVIIPETVLLDEQEQKDFEVLKAYAKADGVTKTRLIDDLAAKIEEKIASSLENISEEQKILIARTEAVKIVEALAKPEVVINENVSAAILNTIHQDKKAVEIISKVLDKDDKLILAAKNGAALVALADRNQKVSTEVLIENLFGPKLSAAIIGPKNIQVVLSEVKIEEQTTYQVSLYDLNKENVSQLHHQESILSTIKEHGQKYGYDKISGVFTNYARTYLEEKVAAMPAGSIFKKAYSSPITQSILAKYGLANPVVWEAVGQSGQFVGFLMKVSPDTTGPLLGFAGKVLGREFVKPVAGLATKQVAGQAIGKVATEVAVKTGLSAFIASLGIPIPGVNIIIGAIAWLGTELLSKAKVLWQKHKEKIKPILAVGATIAAIRFLGVGPGLGVGAVVTFGLMGSAGIATIATGAFGVLGFIGRSIGVAIAAPVIITLLVLPPLVAFIMLVINNSAYVVPPGSTTLAGRSENPYISVTKTANPSGHFENSQLPLKIKYTITVTAKKEPLTNIRFEHTCKVIKEGSSENCIAPTEAPPVSISPTSPYIFSYEANYNTSYNDSLVINTFTVKADATERKDQTASGIATITIGVPPTNCFDVNEASFGNGSSGFTFITNSVNKLISDYNPYASKICASLGGNSIEIVFGGDFGGYWGRYSGGKVSIFSRGIASQPDSDYILFHELAHVLATNEESWYDQYLSFPGIKNDPHPYCFYNYENEQEGGWPFSERFAEAASFYANDPCGNFRQTSPAHYKFMNDVLFK